MTQYELPDGFQGMETVPRKVDVNIVWYDGRYTVGCWDSGDPVSTRIIGWAPIVPLKRKARFVPLKRKARFVVHDRAQEFGPFAVWHIEEGFWVATSVPTRDAAQRIADIYNEVMP